VTGRVLDREGNGIGGTGLERRGHGRRQRLWRRGRGESDHHGCVGRGPRGGSHVGGLRRHLAAAPEDVASHHASTPFPPSIFDPLASARARARACARPGHAVRSCHVRVLAIAGRRTRARERAGSV
jgi:hypothetical protein